MFLVYCQADRHNIKRRYDGCRKDDSQVIKKNIQDRRMPYPGGTMSGKGGKESAPRGLKSDHRDCELNQHCGQKTGPKEVHWASFFGRAQQNTQRLTRLKKKMRHLCGDVHVGAPWRNLVCGW